MPEAIHLIIIILLSLFAAVLLYLCSYKILQIYQMSSYRTREVVSWLKKTKFDYIARYFALAFFVFVPTALFVACFGGYEYVRYIGFLFFVLLCLLFAQITKRQVKVPLKFTARVKRLSALLFAIYWAFSFGFLLLTFFAYLQYAFIAVLALLIPVFCALANTIMLPVENAINSGYRKKAAKKLSQMPDLIKIGITGSYGKTTAKNILAAFLHTRYRVFFSPKSYNTPMGLSRVINDELPADTEVFIAEMGARYKGDIRELCDFIQPSVGVLTAIGDMHLETFGDKQTLISTKYELVECLPPDGLAVFCGQNDILRELYAKCDKNKLISSCKDSRISCNFCNVSTSESGTSFDLELGGSVARICTNLLGQHVAGLVAVCALTAYSLGVSLEKIAESAAKIAPIEHRLQLIRSGNNIIIDDAYNSNPEGAKSALDVLSAMPGTKIVVTPGMIELGEHSRQAHFEFGSQIAECADCAILIGRNAKDIAAGIGEKMQANVFFAKTLDEAMQILGKIDGERKAILFENDLPDNY